MRLSTKAVVVRHTAPAGGQGLLPEYVRACGQRLAAQLQCPLQGPRGSFCSEHSGSGAWPAPLQGEGCVHHDRGRSEEGRVTTAAVSVPTAPARLLPTSPGSLLS